MLCLIAYHIILVLATMNPSGWHPPHLVDNTDTLYLGDQHWQQQCWFFRFLLFGVHLFVYMLVSVSVRLCTIYLKFLKTHYYKAFTELQIKNDKRVVINIRWVKLYPFVMVYNWPWVSQIAGKRYLLKSIACICDLRFRTRTQQSSNCCIKAFSNSLKN